ncbi:LTA synthase family protein [Lactobacillus sp. CC-MHH1034]|uniref:LTA synthase family protein n=1 Tax=Agrilactobacillus fermenti TaxID=2586909 RepID=UPI001E6180C3|nr:LTA synthase family protein [Agrilactobacillus fermenti]MCD2257018.1 LTA synthase family protein [Agrilactobacillus fermenti]
MNKLRIKAFFKSRLGFFTLLLILLWAKSIYIYYTDFSLGLTDPYQHLIMWLTPFGTSALLLSLALYIRKPILSYIAMFVIYILQLILLFANVIYYRQATDFLTINTIMSSSKVSQGLGKSTLSLLAPQDILIWLDVIIILILLFRRIIPIDPKKYRPKKAFVVSLCTFTFFLLNLFLAETSRPQLLTRTFDRNYIVKYLGIENFMFYDAVRTAQNNQVRANSDGSEMTAAYNYIQQHKAAPNPTYFGTAKGKNVIIIHLESFQQFLIDKKIDNQEVTPFLNSLYHDKSTISFSNFFHEVGQGRTSDAETMLETGLFGLPEGSVFTSLGSDNTFEAAPAILQQTQGYDSAVFHGNTGSFWNRKDVYRNLGYNYFFDASYFDTSKDNAIGYGLKDKLLFAESTKYLERLQQPFYTKFITVTNHFPFSLSDTDSDFPKPDTDDDIVNNYFRTAHYLDESLQQFFDYLKASGLYDNTLVMIYGDHYGLSNSDNLSLAPLLDKTSSEWTAFDNAQLQRVPLMFHMPGLKGGINSTYGGEIDVLPTLMHLLGVDTTPYMFMGTDLLSSQHNAIVAFRNRDFVTPTYTVLGGKGASGTVYDNKTGNIIKDLSNQQIKKLNADQQNVSDRLSISDNLNNKNLLRFYTPINFTPVNPENQDYTQNWLRLLSVQNHLGKKSTSVYSQHGGSTTDLYQTDAPELNDDKSPITELPSEVKENTKAGKHNRMSTTSSQAFSSSAMTSSSASSTNTP